MKLTNGDIWNMRKPLETLMDKELPIEISMELAKIAVKINTSLVAIDTVRTKLIKDLGKPKPNNPNAYQITPEDENWGEFSVKFGELLSLESEMEIEKKIILPRGLSIKPMVFAALDKIVTI